MGEACWLLTELWSVVKQVDQKALEPEFRQPWNWIEEKIAIHEGYLHCVNFRVVPPSSWV